MRTNRIRLFIATILFATAAFGQRLIVVDGDEGREPAGPRYESNPPLQAVIRVQEGQRYREADPEESFHDGQRFRLLVSSLRDGYLYVICLNNQGNANVLYPNSFGAPVNHIVAARPLSIPDRAWFQFDEEPGVEHVYLLLSDRPVAELERAGQRGTQLSRRTVDKYLQQASRESYDARGVDIAPDSGRRTLVSRIDLRHEPNSPTRY